MTTPRNHSVFKAFAMLKSFSSPDEWVTSSELSRRANLPEASGYRIIQTLQELGAVTRGPRGGYRPGMLLVSLSEKVIIGDLLHEAGHLIVEELAGRFDVTVHVGILEGGMVTYVSKASTPSSYVINTRRGAQLEAYCSGLGKVLLAALPDDELDNFIMEGELVALTSATIVEHCTLRAELQAAREAGHAVDNCEIRPDMSCIAVPVLHPQGRTVAAISVTEHAEKMSAERFQQLLAALHAAAADIAVRIFPADPRPALAVLEAAKRCKRASLAA